ncbi:MAG TPA: cupredoxin domain-containing protein [Gemmatimonadaceae bacterium]|nr:cupredoxin domain-containing protein [Gemmatimonadaceae bacterium]
MTGVEWLVLLGGAAAIAWVNWYFFLARRGTVTAFATAGSASGTSGASGMDDGTPRVTIAVKGGYEPAIVRVRAGTPVRLVFDRQETSGCSEEIVLPDFGIRRFLPAFQRTTIEVTPPTAGRYEFTCGMSMLRGTLVAED